MSKGHLPGAHQHAQATFTPLPAGVQHYFLTGQPTW